MSIIIRELRNKTGLTQKAFAEHFGIPLSTLRKWEQGESSPPSYVVDLIAGYLPARDESIEKIPGRDGKTYFYDKRNSTVMDSVGNSIRVTEELDGVKRENLDLYLIDLFEAFYEIQERFDRDCRFDKKEDIIWI